ncbi:MAG TPA: alpha/beta fold hydrolase [Candidatus Saccharimonadales bacterium]|nr:alpha/beta fold hydrolase [Candidatus Saccharimonadales bacterium]
MSEKLSSNPADYIVPLNINKLEGRMLHAPALKSGQRDILFVYGHHAMLERWWSLIENLNEYGSVTMPDLPGFGGMDSFQKIGITPDIDAFADYLAAFIKLRFKRKKITIVAVSFGFVIVTRMLQRYPSLARRINLLISVVGFMHRDDFIYPPRTRRMYRRFTRLFATRPMALFIRYAGLNRYVIRYMYSRFPNSKRRMIEVGPEEFEKTMDFEVKLWQANDVRTHWLTTSEFLNLDNCAFQIDLPVIHVCSKEDHYFNNEIIKQHMLIVFKRYRKFVANSKAHTPSILADKQAAGVLLPTGLRKILAKP